MDSSTILRVPRFYLSAVAQLLRQEGLMCEVGPSESDMDDPGTEELVVPGPSFPFGLVLRCRPNGFMRLFIFNEEGQDEELEPWCAPEVAAGRMLASLPSVS